VHADRPDEATWYNARRQVDLDQLPTGGFVAEETIAALGEAQIPISPSPAINRLADVPGIYQGL